MKYTENQIDLLRLEVGKRLSEKRFSHTLGVERMAVKIGEKCLPDRIDELRVAALLHDISKEYSEAEHLELLKSYNFSLSDEDLASPQLWHSFTAPFVVMRDFPEFSCEDILSAVRNHTVGAPSMSVFDEIILLSDYIEDGRSYVKCVSLRESFLEALKKACDVESAVFALHEAVYTSLNNNILEFISRGVAYHSETKATRDAFYAKIKR